MARKMPPLAVDVLDVQRVSDCRDAVLGVLESVGREAGQYHVLSPDPWHVIWNEDRTGFVGFLEEGRCVFVWRSPVAPFGTELDMLSRIQAYTRQRRKVLIAVLLNDACRHAGVRLGMQPVWIGSETYHSLPDWTIKGGRRQKLRWARSHASKLGYEWREADPLGNPLDRAAIETTEIEWKRARKQRSTDSFQRTSFAELTEIRRYFVCEGPLDSSAAANRGVVAFLACTPVNSDGWYLQDPVRLASAPRGALEGCFVAALDALRDDGYKFASNGPLPFWRPEGTEVNEYAVGPVVQRVISFFDRQYRFKGINQFRSKLDPDSVEPLYLLVSKRFITPRVAHAVVKVLTKRLPN